MVQSRDGRYWAAPCQACFSQGWISLPAALAEERVALVLRRVERLEIPEIAEQMGLSVSTVKRRLNAAEARLERAAKP